MSGPTAAAAVCCFGCLGALYKYRQTSREKQRYSMLSTTGMQSTATDDYGDGDDEDVLSFFSKFFFCRARCEFFIAIPASMGSALRCRTDAGFSGRGRLG